MDDLIQRARTFATEAHRRIGHQRKYTQQPYDVHLRSVAERVASVTEDAEMIAAAWLHDVVEDTPATVGEIERAFGRGVADLVDALTDVSLPSDGSRAARKAKDRAHTAGASQRAKTIKLADLIDNAKDICEHDEKFARVYVSEMAALLEVLGEGDASLQRKAQRVLTECAERLGVPHLFPEVFHDREDTGRDDLSLEHRRSLRLFTEAFNGP